jgi:IS30 family transposase
MHHHLTVSHRHLIGDLRRAGHGVRAIGRLIGRDHSVISRELRRNANQGGHYCGDTAHRLATERKTQPKGTERMGNPILRQHVTEMLTKEWSPQIISAKLRLRFQDDKNMWVSHETLYQWIYKSIISGELEPTCLWYPREKRQSRHRRKPAHSRIPNRVDIDERPEIVEERSRVGDWEGDSVVSPKNRGGLATFVERSTRFTIAGHIADKQAQTFASTSKKIFGWIPNALCHTTTLDNGTEMAAHSQLSEAKEMSIYFAHTHSPWQRGANEQINGMIRRYFPKGTDFSKVSPEELQRVITKINKRPRKCLNYRAPYDVFAEALRGAFAV